MEMAFLIKMTATFVLKMWL